MLNRADGSCGRRGWNGIVAPRRPRMDAWTAARRNACCIGWAPPALSLVVCRRRRREASSATAASGGRSRKAAVAVSLRPPPPVLPIAESLNSKPPRGDNAARSVLVHGGGDSPPSIRCIFLSSHRNWHDRLFQGEWRAERSRRRPVPVLHVSEARSEFCNVTKQNAGSAA